MKVFAAVVLAALLAACAPSPPEEAPPPVPKILLTVLVGQSSSDAGTEEMFNDTITKNLPDIELEWESVGWGEKFESQMQAKFAAGEVPDIMIGKAQDVATYVPSGNLAPLSDSLLENISSEALPGVTVGGKPYGIPYNALYQGVFYNKAVFEKYGLQVPTTQEELRGVVAQLKTHGVTPYASHFLENWYVGNILMQFALGEIFNHTPDWGNRFRAGKVSFRTSEDLLSCMSLAKDILGSTWENSFAIDQIQADERFAKGEAAMYVTGSWTLQNISAEKEGLRLGVFPFPNKTGDAKLIFEPNLTFMKSSKSLHPEAVDRVLKFLAEDKELAARVSSYTKASSLLKNAGVEEPLLIQTDIDHYLKNKKVFDATVGNTQLIWSFQEEIANRVDEWLQHKGSLNSVLDYADNNRNLSSP